MFTIGGWFPVWHSITGFAGSLTEIPVLLSVLSWSDRHCVRPLIEANVKPRGGAVSISISYWLSSRWCSICWTSVTAVGIAPLFTMAPVFTSSLVSLWLLSLITLSGFVPRGFVCFTWSLTASVPTWGCCLPSWCLRRLAVIGISTIGQSWTFLSTSSCSCIIIYNYLHIIIYIKLKWKCDCPSKRLDFRQVYPENVIYI